MKLNLNTLLVILAGLGVFAPDVAAVATWLASFHVAWLAYVVRALGLLAAFFAAAPLVVPRLRAFLALCGLATPPGARAPWNPERDMPPRDAPVQINATGGAHSTEDITSPLPSRSKGPLRPGEGGSIRMAALFAMCLTFFLAVCLFSWAARAQEPAPASTCPPLAICVGQWTIQPASAVAYQVNLQTGGWAQGAVLVGFNGMTEISGVPVGAGLYCGAGFSSTTPGTSKQCDLLLNASEWGGVGIGLEQFTGSDGASIYQWLATFAGTITIGSTTSQAKALKRQLMEERSLAVALNDALRVQATRAAPPTVETTIVPRAPVPAKVTQPTPFAEPDIAVKPMGFGGTSSTAAR
jgi:hypothetical protein